MTTREGMQYIGREGILETGNGLAVSVRCVDIKTTYGRIRFQVQPVTGSGLAWVESGLSFETI